MKTIIRIISPLLKGRFIALMTLVFCSDYSCAQGKIVNVSQKEAEKFSQFLIDKKGGKSPIVPLKLKGAEVRQYSFTSGPPDRIMAGRSEDLLSVILKLTTDEGTDKRWICYFTVTPQIPLERPKHQLLDWKLILANRLVTQYHLVEITISGNERTQRTIHKAYRKPKQAPTQ